MNKKLISNPFLFPPSGDNEEEKQLFQVRADIIKDYIKYSIEEFEKAWKEQGGDNNNRATTEEEIKGALFPIPLSSPTVTSTETYYSVMDTNYDGSETFSPFFDYELFEDVDSFGKELDADDKSTSRSTERLHHLDKALTQLNSDEMLPTNGVGKQQQNHDNNNCMSSQGSTLSEMSDILSWGPTGSFGLLDEITKDDPLPPMSSITCVTPVQTHHHATLTVPIKQKPLVFLTTPVKAEPASPLVSSRPSRQRRRSAQTSRNVQDSPMMFSSEESMELTPTSVAQTTVNYQQQEVKPFALATLNGTSNRTRNPSTSSIQSSMATPSSAKARKESQERRKRKYEEEDDNNPSVKNAKAAKMNREKKKLQMNALQTENNTLKTRVQDLEQENEDLKTNARSTEHQKNQEIERLQQQLIEERSKNSGNACTSVRMLGYITNILQAVQPPSQVYITPKLANMPAPPPQEMAEARSRLMEGDVSTFVNDNANYLTVKDPNSNLD